MDLRQCGTCRYRLDTAIFELCSHNASEYKVDGVDKVQFHTRTHMAKFQPGTSCSYFELRGRT